jgi:hypothetical protein
MLRTATRSSARAAVPRRIVGGEPSTEEVGCLHSGEQVGNERQGIATGDEIVASAGIAPIMMATVPTDSDVLANLLRDHAKTNRVDDSGGFVARHGQVMDSQQDALIDEKAPVADPTGVNLDARTCHGSGCTRPLLRVRWGRT